MDNIVCADANDPESAESDQEPRARADKAGALLARA